MMATKTRKFDATAADGARSSRNKTTTSEPHEEGSSSRLVAYVHAYDFVAARLMTLLQIHEVGALSIGDAFYSTCMLCVPDWSQSVPSFVDRMNPSAAALVTHVRLPHVDCLPRK